MRALAKVLLSERHKATAANDFMVKHRKLANDKQLFKPNQTNDDDSKQWC